MQVAEQKVRLKYLRTIWNAWITVAGIIGNLQLILFLSIVYFGMIAIITVPIRLFSDPLRLKRKSTIDWEKRDTQVDMDWMSKQG